MRSRIGIAACAATAIWLLGPVTVASARTVVFDSLGGANLGDAADTNIDPVMSATFKTGASPINVDVALFLSADIPEGGRGDTYTVSLDGGIPLSDLSFDPVKGLSFLDDSPVDYQGPVILPVTFSVTSLSAVPTVERYNEFAGIELNPNALYWIEVSVQGASVIKWGLTGDTSGPGVAGNYLAWFGTDNGFFLNDGVQLFASDQALKMEVDAAPEPSSWAMMLIGFAGLGFAGYRARARSIGGASSRTATPLSSGDGGG